MGEWLKKTGREIRENTAGMDRQQTLGYILTYYWYHILLTLLGAGLLILLLRHIFFRQPPREFTCVLVNQAVDYRRDEELAEAFAAASGIPVERICVDSDYVFSYGDVRLESANESSYEKFFFRWGNEELDAVIMPESFYRYCRELGYAFRELDELLGAGQQENGMQQGNGVQQENGVQRKVKEYGDALRIKDTALEDLVIDSPQDPMVLVILSRAGREEKDRAFLHFALEKEPAGEGSRADESED